MLKTERKKQTNVNPGFLLYRLMTADALLHYSTTFNARYSVAARPEDHAHRLSGAHHALGSWRRRGLDEDLLLDTIVAAETLLHALGTLDAGDTVSARTEHDSDLFSQTHHALGRCR